ncbi:DUF116 domain-containing protein [Thiohalobacter sp. IOR34]|uniref:lipoyl protein ligase domain-containing protein n=1 Tax=Thiohalobacter sp. IOR34 TaxID=3057176 RepID=UPI0025B14A09|nr:DUF116 domain-containing protein [Thiohalobacter sp. IOR34]WJW74869.1 DUF116 domain-containing protein [Thiohalobacter sp. IOR34]
MPNAEIMVVDTGLGSAANNITIDRHWLAEHARSLRPNLLRFFRSGESAWIGLHQWPETELNLDYVREQRIQAVRRLTGGGALYVDSRQLAWSLFLRRTPRWKETTEAELLEVAGRSVVEALRDLGLAARFCGPNDIEVDGRKIASVFVARFRRSYLIQGFLFVDADPERLARTLRFAAEGPDAGRPQVARERVTTLRAHLDRVPSLMVLRKRLTSALLAGFGLRTRPPSKTVYADLRRYARNPPPLPEGLNYPVLIDPGAAPLVPASGYAEARWKTAGGMLYCRLALDEGCERVAGLRLGGDLYLQPVSFLGQLAAELLGAPVRELRERLLACCRRSELDMPGLGAEDLWQVIALALGHFDERRLLGLSPEQANRLRVIGAETDLSAIDILQRAEVMLLPYCAKSTSCNFRGMDGCKQCGACEVGDAFRLAQRHGLEVHSVCNHDHLSELLQHFRARGVGALVANFCEPFFVKRNHVFREAGMPVVLLDLRGQSCYEAGREADGYAGRFQDQARLDLPLLEQVLRIVPEVELAVEAE